MDIFCLKCKLKTNSRNVEISTTKNNKSLLKAICTICGCKKCQFMTSKSTKSGGDIVEPIGKYVGEVHPFGDNYLGPGTKFKERIQRGDKPKDRVDEAAMHHDLAYHIYKDKEKRHEADRKLLQDLDQINNPSFKERIKRGIAKPVIKSKLYLGLGVDK